MKYLLDTNVLIDASFGREPTRSELSALIDSGHELLSCAVTIAEFFSGLASSRRSDHDSMLDAMRYINISPAAARRAGIYRYDYARRGITLSTQDALIAGVAWDVSAILVTSNSRDFPMDDVDRLILLAIT